MRIAVLDDDPVQTAFVRDTMSEVGHICEEFHHGRLLVDQLRRGQKFDLLVLDWLVPDLSGEHVLSWVRENLPDRVPVIFMTARGIESDVVSMLNIGADDYIVKPVSPATLLARANAVLRRAYRETSGAVSEVFDEFEFDLASGLVQRSGASVALTQKEFGLALLLFRNLSRPVSRARIRELIWKQADDIPSRTLDTHLSTLRKKLGLRRESGYLLTPIYGFGYRLERLE